MPCKKQNAEAFCFFIFGAALNIQRVSRLGFRVEGLGFRIYKGEMEQEQTEHHMQQQQQDEEDDDEEEEMHMQAERSQMYIGAVRAAALRIRPHV